MFCIDDLIIYGTCGVCTVTDICPSPFDKTDTRTYYRLKPRELSAGDTIYTPVLNEKIPMRPLLSKEEGAAFLHAAASYPLPEIPVDKQRREFYRLALLSTDPLRALGVLRSIRRREQMLELQRKHLPDLDREFYDRAMRHLTNELSIVLLRPKEEIAELLLKGL